MYITVLSPKTLTFNVLLIIYLCNNRRVNKMRLFAASFHSLLFRTQSPFALHEVYNGCVRVNFFFTFYSLLILTTGPRVGRTEKIGTDFSRSPGEKRGEKKTVQHGQRVFFEQPLPQTRRRRCREVYYYIAVAARGDVTPLLQHGRVIDFFSRSFFISVSPLIFLYTLLRTTSDPCSVVRTSTLSGHTIQRVGVLGRPDNIKSLFRQCVKMLRGVPAAGAVRSPRRINPTAVAAALFSPDSVQDRSYTIYNKRPARVARAKASVGGERRGPRGEAGRYCRIYPFEWVQSSEDLDY